MPIRFLEGDCRGILPTLEAGSVQCCVTSPPYWGLRDYGANGQLGLEATPEEYIAKMVAVFREVWRVLRNDGTLWVNMGDSYASGEVGRHDARSERAMEFGCVQMDGKRQQTKLHTGLKPKDLCMIPARVAMALRADGWYLRSDIIWHKPNPMPESVTDRPTKSHEYIFLLTKAERYFYDAEAIREPHTKPFRDPGGYKPEKAIGPQNRNGHSQWEKSRSALDSYPIGGRNKRSVWTIATQAYSEGHFATFPEELPKICILAGSRPGDTVLDPFAGSGTTGKVAIELGRKAILIELNPAYLDLAEDRTNVTAGFF